MKVGHENLAGNRGIFSWCGKLMPIRSGILVLELSPQFTVSVGLRYLPPPHSRFGLSPNSAPKMGSRDEKRQKNSESV